MWLCNTAESGKFIHRKSARKDFWHCGDFLCKLTLHISKKFWLLEPRLLFIHTPSMQRYTKRICFNFPNEHDFNMNHLNIHTKSSIPWSAALAINSLVLIHINTTHLSYSKTCIMLDVRWFVRTPVSPVWFFDTKLLKLDLSSQWNWKIIKSELVCSAAHYLEKHSL